jgi:hypothetical protein
MKIQLKKMSILLTYNPLESPITAGFGTIFAERERERLT